MVRQGDIIDTNFNPQSGHEQAGRRPGVVVSNDYFNSRLSVVLVCPITNRKKPYPMHIALDNRTETTGIVLCEHIKSLDLNARGYRVIERIPDDLLNEIIGTIFSAIEK